MFKRDYFSKALNWVKNRGSHNIKAVSEGYDEPRVFTNKSTQAIVQADISYQTANGAKHFTDIALKSDNVQKLVTRWKLLSIMAGLKRGKLHLLTPKGHKMFTQKIVNQYNINALIHSI